MTTFTGKTEIDRFTLVVLKGAIKLYLRTGMKANRAYTPTNMLWKASEFTGVSYRRGQLQQAHDDLQKIYDQLVKE